MSRREPARLIYPRHSAGQDPLLLYGVQLLDLINSRLSAGYELRQSDEVMSQSRALIELARPDPPVDVFWTMTHRQREQELLVVRIPLARGLFGWRLPLVRRADAGKFAGVQRLRDLAAFTAVQGHDWPDTLILRANGLPVQTGTRYEALFGMLAAGRADYFPRSIVEIGDELDAHRRMDLVIEPRLLLYYRAPIYFFVAPSRPQLAAHLQQGLEAALADGSFERLFHQSFGALIERHQVAGRQVLHLHNPELSAETPIERKALWWVPAQMTGPRQDR